MYKPAWYKKEEIKLAEEYFNNDKYQNLDDFIEKHASGKWKKYKSKIESEYKKNLKKGKRQINQCL